MDLFYTQVANVKTVGHRCEEFFIVNVVITFHCSQKYLKKAFVSRIVFPVDNFRHVLNLIKSQTLFFLDYLLLSF